MSNHTKTPWRTGKSHCVVADEPVPGMNGSDAFEYYGGHLIAESVTPKNARRIVACVNACVGISNEELHEIADQGGMLTPRQQIAESAQQRHEILEALKRCQAFISEVTDAGGKYAGLHGPVIRDAYHEAAAAMLVIEKAEAK
jgi:hypothetical protein